MFSILQNDFHAFKFLKNFEKNHQWTSLNGSFMIIYMLSSTPQNTCL